MDSEALFNDKAFDCLEPKRKQAFKALYEAIKGKTPEQALPVILAFTQKMPKGHRLTPAERDAMLQAVTADMSPRERANAEKIIKMLLTA